MHHDTYLSGLWFDDGRLVSLAYDANAHHAGSVGSPTAPTSRSSVSVEAPLYLGTTPGGRALLRPDGAVTSYEKPTTVSALPRGRSFGVALGAAPVITVGPNVSGLSLATDLMAPGHLTVHRAEPDWPWSTRQRVAAYAGIAIALLGLASLGLWWWRGRLS